MSRRLALAALTVALLAHCRPDPHAPPRIAGGFPLDPDRRVAHAVTVRVNDSALRAVEGAAPDILAPLLRDGISIPRTEQTVSQGWSRCTVVVCPQGCRVPVQLAAQRPFELHFDAPDRVRAVVRIVVPHTDIPISGCSVSVQFDVDTARGSRNFVGLATAATVRNESQSARVGYDRVDLDDIDEAQGEEMEPDDIVCRAGGFGRVLCAAIDTVLRQTVHDRLREQLANATAPLREMLHEPSTDPPGCPTGTHADGTHCAYADGTPVPVLLGTDGELRTAPGNPAVRWLVAAGDSYVPPTVSATGATVAFFGGAYATAHSQCVPHLDPPRAPFLSTPSAMQQNAPGDASFALSESFANQALFAFWDAGMFCAESSDPHARALATPALRAAFGPQTPPDATFAVHPQRPPRLAFGTDPAHATTLRLEMPQLAIDLLDAHATRITTVTFDLAASVALAANGADLRATAGPITVRNLTATGLAPDAIAQLSSALTTNAAPIVSTALDLLFPVSVPRVGLATGPSGGAIEASLMGDAIRVATEGTERYLVVPVSVRYRGP